VDAAGASTAPVPFLQGEGRPEPNSPLEAVWNSLVESSIMPIVGMVARYRLSP
jgi:hypothetical protein